ncbi:hypothetical protein [Salinispora mooreana]|uniref:hypothetical protein n=1 Tax=Salinispora mooreana TaxID=999545 RepID=UPI00036B894E|nr:hypothetical protein [Salinispora mooreana]
MNPTLLGRPRSASTPHPLDWLTLTAGFEAACILRCVTAPTTARRQRGVPVHPPERVEFNREDAAQRLRHLLYQLEVPVTHERAVGGLRRRYELHQLTVAPAHQSGYAAMLDASWRRGRAELIGAPVPSASGARRVGRTRLAAAGWRAALLAGGRHIRRHILGIRVTDRDLAAILVRSAALLDAPAILRPGTGCYLVSVPHGTARERIMQATELGPPPPEIVAV